MDIAWSTYLASSLIGSVLSVQFIPEYTVAASYVKTFWVLFFVQILGAQVYRMFIYPFFLSPIRHLPSPKNATWHSGNFWEIQREPAGNPMTRWVEEIPHEGLIHYRFVFNGDRILLASPQALGEVLVQKSYDFVKPGFLRGGIARILGVGILLAEGDEHKQQRKNLMPAFAYRHVKDLYPDFWARSCDLINAMTREIQFIAKTEPGESKGHPVLDLSSWLSRVTLEIIGTAGMGHGFNAIDNPQNDLAARYKAVFQPTTQARIMGLLAFFFPGALLHALPVRQNNTIHEASDAIKRVCREIIRETSARMSSEKGRTTKDIVSVALESGGFSEENLVNQMMTFLAAGHETTATAATWAVYELCHHPDMQTRLRQEIRAKIPTLSPDTEIKNASPPSITPENFPYLYAICNETLRFHPPVALTIRESAVNTSILGQFVPKDTRIVIPISAMNKSIQLWGPTAKSFNPNRWLTLPSTTSSSSSSSSSSSNETAPPPQQGDHITHNNTGGATSNYAFLTFLHGPRSCIGQAFAKAELAAILAAVVGKFEMELEDPERKVKVQSGLTARPKDGLPVKLKVVEGW